MTRRPLGTALLAAAALVVLAACGGDNSSSSVGTATTTASTAAAAATTVPVTASPALCSARADLRTSVQDLQNIDLVKNGTNGVKDALTKVKDNLAAVRSAAGSDLQPQITAFDTALKGLQTAVDSSAAAAIATSLKDVVQTGTILLTDLGKLSCP
jgi:hypothetical protein